MIPKIGQVIGEIDVVGTAWDGELKVKKLGPEYHEKDIDKAMVAADRMAQSPNMDAAVVYGARGGVQVVGIPELKNFDHPTPYRAVNALAPGVFSIHAGKSPNSIARVRPNDDSGVYEQASVMLEKGGLDGYKIQLIKQGRLTEKMVGRVIQELDIVNNPPTKRNFGPRVATLRILNRIARGDTVDNTKLIHAYLEMVGASIIRPDGCIVSLVSGDAIQYIGQPRFDRDPRTGEMALMVRGVRVGQLMAGASPFWFLDDNLVRDSGAPMFEARVRAPLAPVYDGVAAAVEGAVVGAWQLVRHPIRTIKQIPKLPGAIIDKIIDNDILEDFLGMTGTQQVETVARMATEVAMLRAAGARRSLRRTQAQRDRFLRAKERQLTRRVGEHQARTKSAKRVKTYHKNWQVVPKRVMWDKIRLYCGNKPQIITTPQKVEYIGASGWRIVYDKSSRYFRIRNPKGQYTMLDGKLPTQAITKQRPPFKTPDGRLITPKAQVVYQNLKKGAPQYQQRTHFALPN